MPSATRLRLCVGLGVAGLAGLLSACDGGGDDVPTLRTVAPSASTTVDAAASTTVAAGTSPSSPSPVTTGRSSGGTAGRPPSGGSGGGGTSAPTAGPVALAPAPPGTYRYDTTGMTTVGLGTYPYPAVTTLTVDPPTGTRQHSTRDLRDPAGNGPLLEMVLDYRTEGVFLEQLRLSTTVSGFTNVRDLRPVSPARFVPNDAAPGARHEFDLSGTGGTAHLVVEFVRRERLTIGGRGVDTLVMHLVATLPPGEVTGTLDVTAWLAPSVRFWVKESSSTEALAGGLVRFQSRYDATLQRLP